MGKYAEAAVVRAKSINGRLKMKIEEIKKAIQSALSPDLLKPYWRDQQKATGNLLTGHCYAATEACYHLLGGKSNELKPHILTNKTFPEGLKKGETHWFLKSDDAVLDPTEKQFTMPVPYEKGRRQAFLTKSPSKRARIIMGRVKSEGE